jgi:inner membrane protein
MMGNAHALSGTAAGLALAPVLVDDFVSGMIVVGLTTASALLPDIDHKSSTVTRSLGPLTKTISWVVRLVTKHRGLTHSVLGIIVWMTALMALGLPDWVAIATGVGCAVHVLGDGLTTAGVFPLWPSKYKLRLSSMKAGSWPERFIITPLLVVACGWFTVQLVF